MRSNASVILLVSLSAVGTDKLDDPKLLSNNAKKRLSTWNDNLRHRTPFVCEPLLVRVPSDSCTHHEVTDDDGSQEKRYTRRFADQ